MSFSSARSSNFFTASGSMRNLLLRSSSCVFSARHTSTTTLTPPLSMPTSAPAHSSGYASVACSWMRSTSPAPILSGKLLLPEALGEVLVSPVAQDGDDGPRVYLLRDPKRRGNGGAGRDADEDPILARHPPDHLVGLLGPRGEVLICYRRVVDEGHDGALHVLHPLQAVEGRVWLEGDDLYGGVVLLEPCRRPDEGAARAEPSDEVRYLSCGLVPDLRRRGLVVRARVGRVGVLVRVEVPLRVLRVYPPRLPDGPVRSLAGIGQHEIHAVGPEDLLPLLAGVFRHAELYLVAERSTDPGVSYARVAAGRIEYGLPRREGARLLAVPDHPQRGSVLDRSTRIVPLRLAENADARNLRRDARQLQKRRVADKLRCVGPSSPINPSNHVGIDYTG